MALNLMQREQSQRQCEETLSKAQVPLGPARLSLLGPHHQGDGKAGMVALLVTATRQLIEVTMTEYDEINQVTEPITPGTSSLLDG